MPTDGNNTYESGAQLDPLPLGAFNKAGSGGDRKGGGRVEVFRVSSTRSLPSTSVLLIRSAAKGDAGIYRCAVRGDARRQLLFVLSIRGECFHFVVQYSLVREFSEESIEYYGTCNRLVRLNWSRLLTAESKLALQHEELELFTPLPPASNRTEARCDSTGSAPAALVYWTWHSTQSTHSPTSSSTSSAPSTADLQADGNEEDFGEVSGGRDGSRQYDATSSFDDAELFTQKEAYAWVRSQFG